MSTGEQAPTDDVATRDVATVEWLTRNAAKVPILEQRDQNTEAWERGRKNSRSGAFDPHEELGVEDVKLPDGEWHRTILAEARGDGTGPFAGACDCDGFRYRGVCAHLVARAVRTVMNKGHVSQDVELFETLANAGGPDPDDEIKHDPSGMSDVGGLEDVDDQENDDVEASDPTSVYPDEIADEPEEVPHVYEDDDQDDEVDAEIAATVGPAQPAVAGDPFAEELSENVPDRFVMELGDDVYIRRSGYAAIARQADLRPSLEAVVAGDETEWTHARYMATVRDATGDVVAQDVGTARTEHEDLANAEAHLDELAATRAIRRALEWATGAGATLERGP